MNEQEKMNKLIKSIGALGAAYTIFGLGGCSPSYETRNKSSASMTKTLNSLDAIAESSRELELMELDYSKINKNLRCNEVFNKIINDKNFDERSELLYFFDNIVVASETTDRYNLDKEDGLSLTWAICGNNGVGSALVFLYSYYAGKEYAKNNYSNVGNMTLTTKSTNGLIGLELTPEPSHLGKNYGVFAVGISVGNSYELIIRHADEKGKIKETIELKESDKIKNVHR